MSRRANIAIVLALAVGLVITLLVWRSARDGEFVPDSSLLPSPVHFRPTRPSPLSPPTATSVPTPEPVPPTGTPPVTEATLEALRVARPTATVSAPSGVRLPYVSPATWRAWALRALALAAALAYIGLRLRPRPE